jgi:hypothetical protein
VSQPSQVALPSQSPRALPPQLVALISPDVGMPRVAREGRARWPLLFAIVCSLALAGAQAYRVNAREETLQQLETQGQLKDSSDRQIEDQTKAAEHTFIVKSVALAVVAPPLWLLLQAAALYLLNWFLRGRSKGGQMMAVAAAVLLPNALADLLSAGAAMVHQTLPTHPSALIVRSLGDVLGKLGVALPGVLSQLAGAFDLFSLWAALLFAFGLATAAQLPTRKVLITSLVAWVLWRLLFACVFHFGG